MNDSAWWQSPTDRTSEPSSEQTAAPAYGSPASDHSPLEPVYGAYPAPPTPPSGPSPAPPMHAAPPAPPMHAAPPAPPMHAAPPAPARRQWLRPAAFAGALLLVGGATGFRIGHEVRQPDAGRSFSAAPAAVQPPRTDPAAPQPPADPYAAPVSPFDDGLPSGTDGTGSDPTGSDPTGSDPTRSDPTGSDPTGGARPGGSTRPGGGTRPGGRTGTSANGAPTDAAAIAKNVDPGVVDINTEIGYGTGRAAGTGVVLTADGTVLTNNHVISGASKISVTDVGNGKTYAAVVVGYDRTHDVAVLKLTHASALKTVTIAAATPKLGAGVVAVGNAGGVGGTPSYAAGVVTALAQEITASDSSDGTSEKLAGLIETNADVLAGDSGGPLVNDLGEVVGIDTAAGSAYRFSNDTNGYAIPIADALAIEKQIVAGQLSATIHLGETAMLGVQVTGARSGTGANGALVAGVLRSGPAATAGITAGDVITSVDGHAVATSDKLTTVMSAEKAGVTVKLGYTDPAGARHTVDVTLAAGPPQ